MMERPWPERSPRAVSPPRPVRPSRRLSLARQCLRRAWPAGGRDRGGGPRAPESTGAGRDRVRGSAGGDESGLGQEAHPEASGGAEPDFIPGPWRVLRGCSSSPWSLPGAHFPAHRREGSEGACKCPVRPAESRSRREDCWQGTALKGRASLYLHYWITTEYKPLTADCICLLLPVFGAAGTVLGSSLLAL
ncbi:uncharacterized protein AAEQ78_009550 [Lycaon pictus]